MSSCAACGVQTPEGARFCPSCGTPLAPAARREELRRVVTVLFCDLTGSTSLAERLEPESLREIMGRYFATMQAIIEHHGGTVEKFIGDAVMAVFGLPAVREDDALRAVRAALEMRGALARLNEELAARWDVRLGTRTGLNTGEVVAGDAARGHGFVTGDAVNVAARLEQAAGRDEILVGEATRHLVRDAVRDEPVEPLALKGKSERVTAFRVLGLRGGGEAPERRLRSPLVGRARELLLLRGAYERSIAESRCALVPVLGPAGAGKSRLTREFLGRLADDASALVGRCVPYGDGITFWPVAEVVRSAAGLTGEEPPDVVCAKLAELLPANDDAETVVQRLAGLLGLADPASYPVEIFWAVRKLLEALAAKRRLVVVFDDVQWAEPTFLSLLEYLATSSTEQPILVMALARTELLELRPGIAEVAAQTIALPALSEDETRLLVENLLGDADVAPEVAARVGEVAEGNPLFVEELLRMLVDEGHLRQQGGCWQAAGELSVIATPPTIQALIAARLDRLAPAERSVIERAAVVGKLFWPSAVRELSAVELRGGVDDLLAGLAEKQLVRRDGTRLAGEDALAFAHILVRDVAYGSVLKATRAELHERFAAWLEQVAGERATAYDEILGHHLEQAYRYLTELHLGDERTGSLASRAVARLESAGYRALARSDMPAAVGLLERASALLPDDDPARQDIALKLGIAFAGTGQLTQARRLLSERVEPTAPAEGAQLVYSGSSGRQESFPLDETAQAMTIGRRLENDIALSWDAEVSRRHAVLERAGDGWALVDDGISRNGSFLNGQRLRGRRPLADGDVMRFGDTVLLYRALARARGRPPVDVPPDGATRLGDIPAPPVNLSDVERRVLIGLRGSADAAPASAAPAGNEEIAARAGVSADDVKAVISALNLKLGVEGASEEGRRERLIVRAANSGLISQPGVRRSSRGHGG